MSEINITKANFDEEVIKSDKIVLADFWAPWCGPCRMVSPLLAEIAQEHPEIKVCKINVDEEVELSMNYKVASIPTMLVFKNGEVVNKMVGASTKKEILEMVLNS